MLSRRLLTLLVDADYIFKSLAPLTDDRFLEFDGGSVDGSDVFSHVNLFRLVGE